jgi:hypothetical protein
MDWSYKAALTGMTVAAVMMAARLLGRHTAGMLAGLPVISAPSLLWLVSEQGVDSAARSAIGGLAACAAAPVFALAFERAAQRHGAWGALMRALLVLIASLALLHPLQAQPMAMLALALSMALLAWRLAVAQPQPAGWVRALRGEPWLSASLAGLVSAGASYMCTQVGPFWTGVVAALPLISGCALVHLQRAGGPSDIRRFIAGYAPGVASKAVFLFTFAMLAASVGAGVALGLAAGCGAAIALAWTLPSARTAPPAHCGAHAEH